MVQTYKHMEVFIPFVAAENKALPFRQGAERAKFLAGCRFSVRFQAHLVFHPGVVGRKFRQTLPRFTIVPGNLRGAFPTNRESNL